MVPSVIHDIALLATLAIIWVIPALLIARLAHRRGYSFGVFVIIALVIPWPITLLAVLAMPGRNA
jgi:hypothetical protein